MPAIQLVIQSLLLVLAVSVDAFVASFSYGVNRIKIPMVSRIIISGICTLFLAVSMFFGNLIGGVLPEGMMQSVCFVILFLLGLVKLFDGAIKAWISRHGSQKRQLSFHFFSLHMILQIYADPSEADRDASRSLSSSEAVSLAVALSFDSLAAGFGAGMAYTEMWFVLTLAMLMGFLCVWGGEWLGSKLSRKIPIDVSWISGLLLIVLACFKL